jgi:hypothetical protein
MRKSLFIAITLAVVFIGANAWADFSLDFTSGTQNLAADAGYTSSTYTSDIVVTNQYQAYGLTFLPAATSGGVPVPGATPDQGTIPPGGSGTPGVVGGATFGLVTSPTSALWYQDSATQIGKGALNTYSTNIGTSTYPFSNNFIGFNNGQNTGNSYDAGGEIEFSSELNSLSFSLSKPVHASSGSGNHGGTGTNKYVYVDFYNNGILVGTDAVTYGGQNNGWESYTSNGSSGYGSYSLNGPFNAVVLDAANPFMIESVSGTSGPSPIPATIWLMSGGLLGFLGLKRKYLS